jgi:hypothetical protein
MLLKIIKANYFLLVCLIIIGLINLFLITLPLTNVFGYEFSATNSLLLSLLSGLYLISTLKSTGKSNQQFNLQKFIRALFFMLLLPFAISIINSFVAGFCSFRDGVFFYLVITVPSVITGSAIGSAAYFLFKKFRAVAFIIIYLMILFIAPAEIYFNPQVYLYNPLFAYFPGTVYDEGLSVGIKLILYRLFNLMFFFSVLLYFFNRGIKKQSGHKRSYFLASVLVVVIIFYFLISPSLGFTTTHTALKAELSNRVESEHFIIQADKRIEKKALQLIALNQEYYYSELRGFFSDEPENKITSFIFLDSEQKKNLIGSGSADIAKPWLNNIYISGDSWENTLRHEIAHCFTANFGTGIFKLAGGFNPALTEGFAEAADGFYDENSIHHLALLAYKNDFKVDLKSLFGSFSFFGNVSSLSYVYSGSFIQFLINAYGIDKAKKFYRTNDFNSAYTFDLADAIRDYETFLDTSSAEGTGGKASYYFGRKPLISKVCPRFVSSRLQEAWGFYSLKEYKKAERIFKEVLSKAENYSAVVGLSKVYEDSDSLYRAIELIEDNMEKFEATGNEYNLKFRLAELYTKNSELEKAKSLYLYLYDNKPNRRIEQLADTRIALLANGNIRDYVTGSDYDKYAILKELNSKSYYYSSIPLMIYLSIALDEDYGAFLLNFSRHLEVKDEKSSYAVFKISEFKLKNLDFINANKMAALSIRYKGNTDLLKLTGEHYKKTGWFLKNADKILGEINFNLN